MDNQSNLTFFGKIYYGIKEMKIYEKILLILSLLVFGSFCAYMLHGANADLSSDSVTGTFLAQDIIRSGSWFPEDWNYGGDIWALRLQMPIAFFSLFSDNFLLVRSISSIVINVILFIGLIYLCRKTFNNNCWLLIVPIIFMGISTEYVGVVLSDCQYNLNMIMISFIFGCYVSYLQDTKKKTRLIKLAVTCILIIYAGFSGMRYVQSVDIPLIAALFISYFYENREAWKDTKKIVIDIVKMLLPIIISMIIGFVAFKLICANTQYHAGSASPFFDNYFADNVATLYQLIINIYGLKVNVEVFSVDGIFNLIKLLGGLSITFLFPALQIRKLKSENKLVRFFIIFSIIHIIEILILSLFSTMLYDASRYLFSSFFLLSVLSCHYIFKYILNNANIIKAITVCCVALFSIPGVASYAQSIKSYSDTITPKMGLVNFLLENDLNWGYASYWNAGVNSFYSNGNVEINSVTFTNNIIPYYWLNSTDRYDPALHEGKSFLLMTQDELNTFLDSQSYQDFGNPAEILTYENYNIYVYNYNISLDDFGGNGGERSLLQSMKSTVNEDNSEDNYTFQLGERWYGPYWKLSSGSYEITIICDSSEAIFNYQITTDVGQNLIQNGQTNETEIVLDFDLSSNVENFELVLDSLCADPVQINSINLKKVS